MPYWIPVLKHRQGYRGGGTALLYRNNLKVTLANSGQLESFEYSEWVVKSFASDHLKVIVIYRPPIQKTTGYPQVYFLMNSRTI